MNETSKIAILIDGDNSQPQLLKQILEEVSKYGKATIRRIYGDWTLAQMNGWKLELNNYSFQPMQKFSYTTGKNSTDGALIIDAMDILHGDAVNGFCIVSSDSDFTGLAKRIREEGLFCMGIGEKKTPQAFIQACEVFTFCENINQTVAVAKNSKKTQSSTIPPDTVALIKKAYENLVENFGSDKIILSQLGSMILKLDSSFDARSFNCKNLKQVIEKIPLFEIKENLSGGMDHPIIQLKK